MNLYVGGDSFCFYRNDPDQDWPLILANQLNKKLQGIGYPGSSWWLTRKHLLEYIKSADYTPDDVFVFCHTDSSRPLLDYYPVISVTPSFEELNKMHFRHFYSEDIAQWALENWYRELNTIVDKHTVLHLFCFSHAGSEVLQGIIFRPTLMAISMRETKNLQDFVADARRNHFGPKNNQWLAGQLFDILSTR